MNMMKNYLFNYIKNTNDLEISIQDKDSYA